MSSKSPKYPVEQSDKDDKSPARDNRRSDETPPYGAPAFRHRHEVRAPVEGGDAAYRRAHPEFYQRPRKRGAGRRVW
jgi:hypothetical protein